MLSSLFFSLNELELAESKLSLINYTSVWLAVILYQREENWKYFRVIPHTLRYFYPLQL